ncbi:hypothetical protein L4X63_22580 [Geomonas sp. Red32]|uniref:hypothetical protein n=1 Tax=Geomonas sp. Red32 TaxID=2912856 RepID=UPI00202D0A4D|nr:hypothetical protein [Geomonas sp. Red32]MCM0084376.1 hypothetical protein [Geomonas sp. Red32]
MKTYTQIASTLYDEQQPVGYLGRGTHYSVLSTITWISATGERLDKPHRHHMAVIWDEDHDERVIKVIERIYKEGLLASVLFIGERKGSLTVLTAGAPSAIYIEGIREHGQPADEHDEDWWDSHVHQFGDPEASGYIIHAEDERVDLYLRNILSLWRLGIHPL